eukprot:m.31811 g.31811  ORF g.31811 m.31811 type:complete len:342 (-) comp9844_c0_seq2:1329-2354(-)
MRTFAPRCWRARPGRCTACWTPWHVPWQPCPPATATTSPRSWCLAHLFLQHQKKTPKKTQRQTTSSNQMLDKLGSAKRQPATTTTIPRAGGSNLGSRCVLCCVGPALLCLPAAGECSRACRGVPKVAAALPVGGKLLVQLGLFGSRRFVVEVFQLVGISIQVVQLVKLQTTAGGRCVKLPVGVVLNIHQVFLLVHDANGAPVVGMGRVNKVAFAVANAFSLDALFARRVMWAAWWLACAAVFRGTIRPFPDATVIVVVSADRLVLDQNVVAPVGMGLASQDGDQALAIHKVGNKVFACGKFQKGRRDVDVSGNLRERRVRLDSRATSHERNANVSVVRVLL